MLLRVFWLLLRGIISGTGGWPVFPSGFKIFLGLKILDLKQFVKQLVQQVCHSRYHVSFYLWLIGSVLKHCKVPKYYDHDCSFTLYCNGYVKVNRK